MSDRPAKNIENTIMGCMASAAAVCIMIPMDTIKTRLVTQLSTKTIVGAPYKGIIDCAVRVAREEGMRTFYSGLPPRLLSVVPMIGIQFGVYEAMKKAMLYRSLPPGTRAREGLLQIDRYGPEESLEEAAMEVAASSVQPLPAPHFLRKVNSQKIQRNWFGAAEKKGGKSQ
jgi:Mitochondrial carrier protein